MNIAIFGKPACIFLQCFWLLCISQPWQPWNLALTHVKDFAYIEDFWSLFNSLKPPTEVKLSYYLFKKGIRPEWEDEINESVSEVVVFSVFPNSMAIRYNHFDTHPVLRELFVLNALTSSFSSYNPIRELRILLSLVASYNYILLLLLLSNVLNIEKNQANAPI